MFIENSVNISLGKNIVSSSTKYSIHWKLDNFKDVRLFIWNNFLRKFGFFMVILKSNSSIFNFYYDDMNSVKLFRESLVVWISVKFTFILSRLKEHLVNYSSS